MNNQFIKADPFLPQVRFFQSILPRLDNKIRQGEDLEGFIYLISKP